ncbi:hypothetical protein VF06_28125, partial [Nostoc linckia z4]
KPLSELVVEVASLIAEINQHPEYEEIEKKGYESNASVGDAYQAMVDLNYEICQTEKKVNDEQV